MSFSCKTGFSLQGTATRKCQADGTWTSGEVVCLGIGSSSRARASALHYSVKSLIDFAETYSLLITDPVDSVINP